MPIRAPTSKPRSTSAESAAHTTPRRRLPRALLVLLVLGSGAAAANDTAGTAGTARGAALIAPFKSSFMAALARGLAGGPAAAVESCHHDAPGLAAAAAGDGVRIGRASDRLRNPANAAPAWVAPLLAAYLDGSAGLAGRGVALGDGRRGYVEPIIVQPMCLACHGETLDADVGARIVALYPDDRATGYRVGDVRGVFWVEYDE